MQVQQFYDYTDMLKANLQSAITIGGKLQFKDDKQYQEFLDAGLIIGSLLVNSESANVYNTSDNTIWNAVEAKVTLWGGNPQSDMNLRHLALVEVLEPLSAPDDILVQIEKVRVVAKFDVVDETKIQFGDQVYVQADPYTSLKVPAWFDENVSVFRYMVDPVNGDNANSGLLWSKAKKDIEGVLADLPTDLGGPTVYVLVKSGTVQNQYFTNINGIVDIRWVGTSINAGTDDFSVWARAGETVAIADDNDLVFEGVGGEPAFKCYNETLTVLLTAKDESVAHNQGHYWGRIKFRLAEAGQTVAVFGCGIKAINIHVDLENATSKGIEFAEFSSGYIKTAQFVGGASTASTQNGVWKGAIASWHNSNSRTVLLFDEPGAWGFDVSAARPNGKDLEVSEIKQLYTNQQMSAKGFKIYLHHLNYDAGLTGYTPEIYLDPSFEGTVKYDESLSVLNDNSVAEHTVIENDSGNTIKYISAGLKSVGTDIISKIPTSAPADAKLANQNLVFFMDETTDTLKVKYKDSGGVVQTGDIAILT